MQTYSQRDTKWSGEILGESKTTIGSHGCTITAIAMLAGITPKEVNERLRNNGGFAAPSNDPTQKNLVLWTKLQACIPWIQFEWRGYTYENDRVATAIAKNGGCLVEVDGSPIGGTKHWVLYIGNLKMIDPWDGKEKATSSYKALGYAIINKVGNPPVTKDPWLENSDKWRGLCWYLEMPKDPETTLLEDVKSVIAGLKSRATDLFNQLTNALAEKLNREEQVSRLKDQLLSEQKLADERYSALNEQLKIAQKQVGPLERRVEELQGQVDRISISLGEERIKSAQLEADLKLAKDKTLAPMTAWDILVALATKLVPFLKNIQLGRST